jgi:hypothetical protein
MKRKADAVQQRSPKGSGDAEVQMVVWVPADLREAVHVQARRAGVTTSEWVRQRLRTYLE